MRAKSSGVRPAAQPVSKVFGAPPQKAKREPGIRPGLFYLAFAALFGTNVLTLVGFLMAPDIAALLNGQNDVVVSAYEDRIAQLRVEVDRLHSRQFAQAGDINLHGKIDQIGSFTAEIRFSDELLQELKVMVNPDAESRATMEEFRRDQKARDESARPQPATNPA